MSQPTPELHATASRPIRVHPAPQLSAISPDLRGAYHPSPSGVDSNLLIMFHGLGEPPVLMLATPVEAVLDADGLDRLGQVTRLSRLRSWGGSSACPRRPS